MFDERLKREYQSVTPSEGFQQRILSLQPKPESKRRPFRPALGAALAAAVIAAFLFWPRGMELTINGESLTASPMEINPGPAPTAFQGRAAVYSLDQTDSAFLLELELDGNHTVTVTNGSLFFFGESGWENAGKATSFSERVSLCWQLDEKAADISYELAISGQTNTVTLTLFQENGQWYLSKK